MATPSRTTSESSSNRQRRAPIKAGVVFLCVLVLMVVGYRGKQQARRQGRVEEVALLRDQLQKLLDEEHGSPGTPARGGGENASSPAPNPQVNPVVNALKAQLAQFEADYKPARLSAAEGVEIRLSRAALANAERRFADALTAITGEDEKERPGASDAQSGRQVRVLETRGDSYFGLRDWTNALDRYLQVLALRPNRMSAMARVADCQSALGQPSEAAATGLDLAKKLNERGNALLAQGKLDAGLGHFDRSVELLTRLVAQERRRELEKELAVSLHHRGLARRAQGNFGAVIADFRLAEEICARLIEKEGQKDLARQHAMILTQLSWILATSPDSPLRDGRKAREFALKACELSEWKAGAAVESLAAACAETGSFADAVKWQEKALELAPPAQQALLRSRLELYQSGKPYRLSPSRAN